MRRASYLSIGVGVLLGAAGLGALGGMRSTNVEQARAIETRMEDVKHMLDGQGGAGNAPAAGTALELPQLKLTPPLP